MAAARARAAKGIDGVVNLNTAPATVLALLPGVGPSKAAAIVGYRTRRPFRTVDELVRIKGIGRKMVRRLRPHLAVAGPTTAATSAGGSIPAAPAPAPPQARAPPPPPRCAMPVASPRRPRGETRDTTPRGPFRSACAGAR
ncbi:MAG TPA: helix-hairpin-helix domain-containing protein [Polyangia bacterium]|nr:helix-hairpin-helix domain-containing protein [Polyangia bacterium]